MEITSGSRVPKGGSWTWKWLSAQLVVQTKNGLAAQAELLQEKKEALPYFELPSAEKPNPRSTSRADRRTRAYKALRLALEAQIDHRITLGAGRISQVLLSEAGVVEGMALTKALLDRLVAKVVAEELALDRYAESMELDFAGWNGSAQSIARQEYRDGWIRFVKVLDVGDGQRKLSLEAYRAYCKLFEALACGNGQADGGYRRLGAFRGWIEDSCRSSRLKRKTLDELRRKGGATHIELINDDAQWLFDDRLHFPLALLAGFAEMYKPDGACHFALYLRRQVMEQKVGELLAWVETYESGGFFDRFHVAATCTASSVVQVLHKCDFGDRAEQLAVVFVLVAAEASLAVGRFRAGGYTLFDPRVGFFAFGSRESFAAFLEVYLQRHDDQDFSRVLQVGMTSEDFDAYKSVLDKITKSALSLDDQKRSEGSK